MLPSLLVGYSRGSSCIPPVLTPVTVLYVTAKTDRDCAYCSSEASQESDVNTLVHRTVHEKARADKATHGRSTRNDGHGEHSGKSEHHCQAVHAHNRARSPQKVIMLLHEDSLRARRREGQART